MIRCKFNILKHTYLQPYYLPTITFSIFTWFCEIEHEKRTNSYLNRLACWESHDSQCWGYYSSSNQFLYHFNLNLYSIFWINFTMLQSVLIFVNLIRNIFLGTELYLFFKSQRILMLRFSSLIFCNLFF